MKIVIPGGSGQVGNMLARAFHKRGDEVVVLSRHPQPAPWRTATWDGKYPGAWASEIDGADAVIHLSGRTVNCRYTPQHRKEILESRTLTTLAVGQAIAAASRRSIATRSTSPRTSSPANSVATNPASPRLGASPSASVCNGKPHSRRSQHQPLARLLSALPWS